MKSFVTILLVVLACLCLVKDADAWNPSKGSDRNTCGHKNPNVVNAIETFCFGNKNMVSSLHHWIDICMRKITNM
jgi:Ni,Fe-hydrogenase I large subunit